MKALVKKITYVEEDINLEEIASQIEPVIDYTNSEHPHYRQYAIIRNDSFDAVKGIKVDEILVNQQDSTAMILFHVVASGKKYRVFSFHGYDGRDMRIFRGHDVIWNHTQIPYEQFISSEYNEETGKRSEQIIEGTMTDHFENQFSESEDGDLAPKVTFYIVQEPCVMYDLYDFFGRVFERLNIAA